MTCEYCNKPGPEQCPQLVELKGKKCCIVCAAQMPLEFAEAIRQKVDPYKRRMKNRAKRLRKKTR